MGTPVYLKQRFEKEGKMGGKRTTLIPSGPLKKNSRNGPWGWSTYAFSLMGGGGDRRTHPQTGGRSRAKKRENRCDTGARKGESTWGPKGENDGVTS